MKLSEQSINIRGSFCIEEIPKPAGFIIFGVSGDLTSRKLIPSLFFLFKRNLLSGHFYLLGCARTRMDDNSFRTRLSSVLENHSKNISQKIKQDFLGRCFLFIRHDDMEVSWSLITPILRAWEKDHERVSKKISLPILQGHGDLYNQSNF